MKDLNELVKDVERDLLANILFSLKHKKLEAKEAKELAKEFVSERFESYEALFEKLYFLSKTFKEARSVFVKYVPSYHQERDLEALRNLRQNELVFLKRGGA